MLSTILERSGSRSGPSQSAVVQRQWNERQWSGRVAWMPQPRPGLQCPHHWPAGLASAGTSQTLQQSVQAPQARPGAGCEAKRAGSSTGLIGSRRRPARADPAFVPEHGVHHGPKVEAVVDLALDLPAQEARDVLTVQVALADEFGVLQGGDAALAEVRLLEPLVHRRPESLLAPVKQVVVHVGLGDLLEDF